MDLFFKAFTPPPLFVFFVLVWSLFWKGLALWRSAQDKQRNWFIAMLVLNTIGIVEIVYLFKYAHKKLSLEEMKSWIIKKK